MRLLLAVLVLAGAFAVGLADMLAVLHFNWTELYGHFEHGYLVLALSVWMAWKHWRAAAQAGPARAAPARQVGPPSAAGGIDTDGKHRATPHAGPDWLAAVPLVVILALLAAMQFMGVNTTRLALLPLLLLAGIALVGGRTVMLRLLWPVLFLYFAMPHWWVFNGLLQELTTAVVTQVVAWTGPPAYMEGNVVHIPAGVFEIASGCSGLNYLMTGTALAGFYALMYLRGWSARLKLLVLAAAVSLFANWVRVYALIVIGHVTDMRHYLIVVEHHSFGWGLFMVLMVGVLFAARSMELREGADVR